MYTQYVDKSSCTLLSWVVRDMLLISPFFGVLKMYESG